MNFWWNPVLAIAIKNLLSSDWQLHNSREKGTDGLVELPWQSKQAQASCLVKRIYAAERQAAKPNLYLFVCIIFFVLVLTLSRKYHLLLCDACLSVPLAATPGRSQATEIGSSRCTPFLVDLLFELQPGAWLNHSPWRFTYYVKGGGVSLVTTLQSTSYHVYIAAHVTGLAGTSLNLLLIRLRMVTTHACSHDSSGKFGLVSMVSAVWFVNSFSLSTVRAALTD